MSALCQERTSGYSITSSALASNEGGTVTPSVQVDDHLVLRWRLHWHVGRLFTLEDAIDIARCASVEFDLVSSVEREPSIDNKVTLVVDRQ
jgi:hypothetical protein